MATNEKKGVEFVRVKETKTDLRREEPPLVDVKVANPVTYLKTWWKRIIGNDGIEFRVRVKPLTAIAISLIIVTVTFGLGRFRLPFKVPFFEYSSEYEPTPTPVADLTRETAFVGMLRRVTEGRYYLSTSSSEVINLEVPENIDLSKLESKRILAVGRFNPDTRILVVENVEGLEVLTSYPSPIPTNSPSPIPVVTPSFSPSSTPSASPASLE